ncbi:MAG: hypothetical protein AAF471_07025 [Myxococcota bacterium]
MSIHFGKYLKSIYLLESFFETGVNRKKREEEQRKDERKREHPKRFAVNSIISWVLSFSFVRLLFPFSFCSVYSQSQKTFQENISSMTVKNKCTLKRIFV